MRTSLLTCIGLTLLAFQVYSEPSVPIHTSNPDPIDDDNSDVDPHSDITDPILRKILRKLDNPSYTESSTDWQDPDVVSYVVYDGEPISITTKVKIRRIELLFVIPSRWPIIPDTAFLIDARDPRLLGLHRKNSEKPLTADALIKNKVS